MAGFYLWVVAMSLFLGLALSPPLALGEGRGGGPSWQLAQGRWDEEAEKSFGLGRGAGRQLMSQEEWQEHRQKMQGMSEEERERYREEWHKKMTERARERGIAMPESPGPRGGGGPRPGGGPGRGMGRGGRR